MIFFIRSLKHLPISIVTPLGNLIPLFSLILGFTLLNEVIGIYQILGVFILIFGSYILSTDGHIKNAHKPLKKLFNSKYMYFILISTVFMALVAIMSKIILGKGIPSLDLLFYHNGFSALIFLCITFIVYDGIKDLKEGYSIAGWWILVIAVFGATGAYTKLMALSDPLGKVSLVIPFIRLRGLISTVFGGALFHEEHIFSKAVACVLMLIGVGLIVV
jgi:drug/metabolite transporter (DMT)-like permease